PPPVSHAILEAATPEESPRLSPARLAWFALVVLTLMNLLNYLDRYVSAPIGESLRESPLHVNDKQFGLLASAFLIVYMIAAPFFGERADRRSRPRLIAIGVGFWSIMTALAGLATNYPSLLGARAAVGIGEAAYATIAPALLADLFPERLRGRIFAVFFMATPVGAALGYVLGGVVDHHFGWRAAFFIAGIPGLILAALALRLPDPERGATDTPASRAAAAHVPSGFAVYRALARMRMFRVTVLGFAAYTFALGGIAVFMPKFLERVRGVPREQAAVQLGAVLAVTGLVGTLVGGWVGDWLLVRTRRAYLWVSAVSTLLAVPLAYIALSSPDRSVYWPALIASELLVFACTGPVNSAVVGYVPAASRAAAMALCIFVIHVLGDVPSPFLIGAVSDATNLQHAVMMIPVALAIGGLIWLWGALATDA
ncbi:MAG: spinster family MFS transporter, partial [Gemmatimonadaceae bacterium]